MRAIILTGVPGQFCAGTDLTELRDVEPGTDARGPRRAHRRPALVLLDDASTPVIVAIDGPAAGLGVELSTQADFRIASTRARFSWIFVQRGLIPDTGAGTWLLPDLVGPQQAKRLVFSGEFIDAQEAQRIGFVMDVVEPEDLLARGSRAGGQGLDRARRSRSRARSRCSTIVLAHPRRAPASSTSRR